MEKKWSRNRKSRVQTDFSEIPKNECYKIMKALHIERFILFHAMLLCVFVIMGIYKYDN